MNRLAITTAAALSALAACCVWGAWVYEGQWGTYGSREGYLDNPVGIAVAPCGAVYVADNENHRVQYFTADGSFPGAWGKRGSGPGEFYAPWDVAVSPNGNRVYIAESGNHRIQYFRSSDPAVEPVSLGRVKALFR